MTSSPGVCLSSSLMMRSLVQVYCRTCQSCICAICVLEEHRTHKTVSVQTERLGKQVEHTCIMTDESVQPMRTLSVITCSETGGEDGAGDPEPDQREGGPREPAEEETGGRQGHTSSSSARSANDAFINIIIRII